MSVQRLDLPIEGMTCAACAVRVEKKLNKLDGVSAAVNYATERASVAFDAGHGLAGAAGRGRRVSRLRRFAAAWRGRRGGAGTQTDGLRQRLAVSAVLTLPVLALAMIPPLQFEGWEWVSLLLATPVVLWGGWPFHRAALVNARHGAATMDTLISIGTLAAWSWSLVALGFDEGELYFEVASVVTVFILMGRYFEARAQAPRGGGAEGAARARCEGRAPSSGPTAWSAAWPSRSCASAISSSSDRARRSPPTASSSRVGRPSTRRC